MRDSLPRFLTARGQKFNGPMGYGHAISMQAVLCVCSEKLHQSNLAYMDCLIARLNPVTGVQIGLSTGAEGIGGATAPREFGVDGPISGDSLEKNYFPLDRKSPAAQSAVSALSPAISCLTYVCLCGSSPIS